MTGSLDSLPEVLANIADATTVAVALKLAGELGGTEIYLRGGGAPPPELIKAVGRADAKAIQRAMGRGKLLIPMLASMQRAKRNSMIVKARAMGERIANLARRFEAHERTIYRVTGGAPKSLPLFDDPESD